MVPDGLVCTFILLGPVHHPPPTSPGSRVKFPELISGKWIVNPVNVSKSKINSLVHIMEVATLVVVVLSHSKSQ